MSPEDLMRNTDTLLVEMHAANVRQVHDTSHLRDPAEQTKLLGAVALTARRVHATLAMNRRTQAEIAANTLAIKASAMKAGAANENEAAAQQEQEMDDDSGRTPERLAALDADLKRRLADLEGRREAKAMVRPDALVGDRAANQAFAAGPKPAPETPD